MVATVRWATPSVVPRTKNSVKTCRGVDEAMVVVTLGTVVGGGVVVVEVRALWFLSPQAASMSVRATRMSAATTDDRVRDRRFERLMVTVVLSSRRW